MEPRDGSGGSDEQRPAKKTTRKRASGTSTARRASGDASARKRAPNADQAGENGVATVDREGPQQTAYDVKEIHRSLSDFTDDDLKQIPIVPEGAHLEQGGTYIDLADERPSEVKVNAGVIARAGNYYVPKNRVPYTIWNRLIGEAKPGQEASGVTDRSVSDRAVADMSTAGQAMGDQPAAAGDAGGDDGYGHRDADRAAQVAADLKSWMDSRQEDRDEPREVL